MQNPYLLATIPAIPTLPIPSKPSRSIKQVMAVHPACPCLQTNSCLEGKVHILRPDTCPKAIVCVVGQSNGLFGCTEGQDSQNWTEDLKGRNQCKWTSIMRRLSDVSRTSNWKMNVPLLITQLFARSLKFCFPSLVTRIKILLAGNIIITSSEEEFFCFTSKIII